MSSSQETGDYESGHELDLFDKLSSLMDIDEAAKRCVLAEKFHLTHFRGFQSRIIKAVLSNRDSLVIQPTGSGKSLCFQFPAIYQKAIPGHYTHHQSYARPNSRTKQNWN